MGKLAQRYAKALLKAVIEEQGAAGSPSPAQQLAAPLLAFAALWEQEKELAAAITNPMFGAEDRLKALLKVAEQQNIPDLGRRFLRVLFERERIAALPAVARAFAAAADAMAGVVSVEVIVASDAALGEKQRMEEEMGKRIPGKLRFSWSVDPSLVGGMMIKYQGKNIDGSVRGRLERLEQRLRAY